MPPITRPAIGPTLETRVSLSLLMRTLDVPSRRAFMHRPRANAVERSFNEHGRSVYANRACLFCRFAVCAFPLRATGLATWLQVAARPASSAGAPDQLPNHPSRASSTRGIWPPASQRTHHHVTGRLRSGQSGSRRPLLCANTHCARGIRYACCSLCTQYCIRVRVSSTYDISYTPSARARADFFGFYIGN